MLKSDVLNQLKQLKSDIKASRNLAIGIVKGTGQKFGFVTLEETGKDVYLPPDEMQKVLPGDRVEVEIKKDAKNKNMAVLEKLLEHGVKTFCGKYVTKGTAHFVEPDLPGMSRWIFVPPPKRKNAKAKDYVKCRMTQHPFKSGKAQASVLEVIGEENQQGIEWDYAIAKHDINTAWSKEVETELETYDASMIADRKAGREDLTHVPFLTIDSKSTTDMDDALWAEKTDNGWTLKVAIADPCALIPPGSAIEKEALQRATSIYFPGQHVSMLPAKLSGDLCSLVEGEERLVKVVTLSIDESGELKDSVIIEAAIKSQNKLSYGEVASYLDGSDNELNLNADTKAQLSVLDQVAKALASWREANALVHEDRDEFFIELNDEKKIHQIHKKISTVAHRLVEECMVVANRAVADFLQKANVPSLFITHNGVRFDRVDALETLLRERLEDESINLKDLNSFVSLVTQLAGDESTKDLHLLVMRQLEKSQSALNAAPHFGMGLPAYTTFTSPIRKGNDFIIHRQVSALLNDKKPLDVNEKKLDKLENAWQTARGAVYDVEQWLKCQYMQSRKDYYEATVLRVFASGFQVRLIENGIEGFVSTKEMEGKYSFHQDQLLLKGKTASFALDQKVKVKLKQIDWTRKQMQFEVDLGSTESE